MPECCEVKTATSLAEQLRDFKGKAMDRTRLAKAVVKWGIALVIAGQSMLFGLGVNMTPISREDASYWWIHGGLALSAVIVFALLGRPLVKRTFQALAERRLSVESLFLVSLMGAWVGSLVSSFTGVGAIYYEVVSVVLCIYTIGTFLGMESRKRAIAEVEKLKKVFDWAWVINEKGQRTEVPQTDLDCCSQVRVMPGEAVTVDGLILEGGGYFQETMLTGELDPVHHGEGDFIRAGSYAVDGAVTIKPGATAGQRGVDKMIQSLEEAESKPSDWQKQADQIIQYFVPVVCLVSLITFMAWLPYVPWTNALFYSMAVLLVACPCALGLATPIAVWRGVWQLSKRGIVSQTGRLLNVLCDVGYVVFDKTGTLSEGSLVAESIQWIPEFEGDKAKVIDWVVSLESSMDHPIAKALSKLSGGTGTSCTLSQVTFTPGEGVRCQVDLNVWLKVGSADFIGSQAPDKLKKWVGVALDDKVVGWVEVQEAMREGLEEALEGIHQLGVKGMILSGDPDYQGGDIGGFQVKSGLKPEEKQALVRELKQTGAKVLFIGDGGNDAPGMAEADGALVMEGGADLAESQADGKLIGNDLRAVVAGIKMARKLKKSIRINMLFALCYNVVGISLAAAGYLHPIVAVSLMMVSSIIVSYRAIRSARAV